MNYKIVVDSCTDLTNEMLEKFNAVLAPLTINIGEKEIIDDKTFDQKQLLIDMKKSKEPPKTSCPSPSTYEKEFRKYDNVFVVTLSDKLSGSYNSAMLAKNIVEEETKNFIHVFNSKSAAIAQVLITKNIFDNIKEGFSPQQVVENVENFIKNQKTFFVLESLENLIKNGRMTNIQGMIAGFLSLKPIMLRNKEGYIDKYEIHRGMKKSLKRLVEVVGENLVQAEDKVFGISHCNCYERALALKKEIEKRYNFKDIIIVDTRGIASVYAYDGGIVISW